MHKRARGRLWGVVFLALVVLAGLGAGILWRMDRLDEAGIWVRYRIGVLLKSLGGTIVAGPLENQLAAKGLSSGDPVFIRIFKDTSSLELWMKHDGTWQLFKAYDICYFSGKPGPKLVEGDRQAVEGFYHVGLGQLVPDSTNYRAFNIGFPNAYDRAHGRTGTYLMVHGDCRSIGCYAMTDAGIAEIYALVEAALRNGQADIDLHAFPFALTDENLAKNRAARWAGFWTELRPGYEYFEASHTLPDIKTIGGQYILSGTSAD